MLRSIGQHKRDSLFIFVASSGFSIVGFVSLFYFEIEKEREVG